MRWLAAWLAERLLLVQGCMCRVEGIIKELSSRAESQAQSSPSEGVTPHAWRPHAVACNARCTIHKTQEYHQDVRPCFQYTDFYLRGVRLIWMGGACIDVVV